MLKYILGRWWIVGSAWTGQSKPSTLTTPTADDWVMSIARTQQMNTDIRKTIFAVLMTSEVSNKTILCCNNETMTGLYGWI